MSEELQHTTAAIAISVAIAVTLTNAAAISIAISVTLTDAATAAAAN